MKKIASKFWPSVAGILLLSFCISLNVEAQQVLRGHVPAAISKLGLHPLAHLEAVDSTLCAE